MEHEKWKIGSKWKTRGGECAEVLAYRSTLLHPLIMQIGSASFRYWCTGASPDGCQRDIVGPWEEAQELKIEVGHIYQLGDMNGKNRAYITEILPSELGDFYPVIGYVTSIVSQQRWGFNGIHIAGHPSYKIVKRID